MIPGLLLFLLALPSLEVSHQARALQPGEVVEVRVGAPFPLVRLEGRIFGHTFYFNPEGKRGHWSGLVGIDLETAPGSYTLELEGLTRRGETLRAEYPLPVRSRHFPTRRLRVPQRFVSPPPTVQERIRRESKAVSRIFSTVTPRKLWQGPFHLPVAGPPTSSFGKRSILNGRPRSPHTGTDFRSPAGAPVHSPAAGRVVLARELYYSGNTVIVDHGQGLYSYFGHLSRIDVRVGQELARDQLLGAVGASGRVTGPHLHWTVRLDETRVDPLSLVEVLKSP